MILKTNTITSDIKMVTMVDNLTFLPMKLNNTSKIYNLNLKYNGWCQYRERIDRTKITRWW